MAKITQTVCDNCNEEIVENSGETYITARRHYTGDETSTGFLSNPVVVEYCSTACMGEHAAQLSELLDQEISNVLAATQALLPPEEVIEPTPDAPAAEEPADLRQAQE